MKWTDATSYSRDQKSRVPTCWKVSGSSIDIAITCGHILYPNEWVMHCKQLGMQAHRLRIRGGVDRTEEAKLVAVKTVKEWAEAIAFEARRIASEVGG